MMDQPRLEFLLDRYVDQALDGAERAELEQMLLASAEARRVFWDFTGFHAQLRQFGEEQQGVLLAGDADVVDQRCRFAAGLEVGEVPFDQLDQRSRRRTPDAPAAQLPKVGSNGIAPPTDSVTAPTWPLL